MFFHMPPAPRNVGSPEEADRPAPQRARIRSEEDKYFWNCAIASGVANGLGGLLAMVLRNRNV